MTDDAEPATDEYVFYGGAPGRHRLRILAGVMRPSTTAFLDRLGIAAGWHVLDAGCGGGDVTIELARRVPDGQVVGMDVDAEQLRLAADDVRAAGLDNIDLRAVDLTEDAPTPASFDLVYVRFVLTHLASPVPVLAALVAACRPGGVVAIEDIDIDASLCDPPSAAFDTFVDWYGRAHRGRGGDPTIGRRLVSMLVEEGVEDVDARIVQPAGTRGDIGHIAPLTMVAAAGQIVDQGIADAGQVAAVVRELAALGERPDTLVTMPRVVQAWGTRS